MKRAVLYAAAAAIAFLAVASNAEASRNYQNRDRYDAQHASYDEIAVRLENQGYSNVVERDNNRFDPWMKVHATDPNGQRVFILLDNTGNVIRVTPLSGQVAEN